MLNMRFTDDRGQKGVTKAINQLRRLHLRADLKLLTYMHCPGFLQLPWWQPALQIAIKRKQYS